MSITLIAAIGKNRELGKDNELLWDLPDDMKHFRERTKGATVLMGRKTYESIGRPLSKRTNIVLTRDCSWQAEGVEVVHSLEEVLEKYSSSSSLSKESSSPRRGGGGSRRDFLNKDVAENQKSPPSPLFTKEGKDELFVIGGAEIYRQTLPYATHLSLTFVDDAPEADAFFPEVDFTEWREVSAEVHEKDEQHGCGFMIKEFVKKIKE